MLQDLNLRPLHERRKQRLTLLYKIIEGLIPALPSEKFMIKAENNERKIRPRTFKDHIAKNIVDRYAYNNTRDYKVPNASTEQYQCSFFVQTVEH